LSKYAEAGLQDASETAFSAQNVKQQARISAFD
jgi:hypothetical protein